MWPGLSLSTERAWDAELTTIKETILRFRPYISLWKSINGIVFNKTSASASVLSKFKAIYEDWIIANNYDLNKVKTITALIFLNMSPLHDEKFGKMLWFKCIEILSNVN